MKMDIYSGIVMIDPEMIITPDYTFEDFYLENGNTLAPKSIQKLLNNAEFRSGIKKAKRILGE